jgi:restriction system protein
VSRIDSKIVLIDGDALAQLMIDHGLGVTTTAAYEVKKIDTDYFAEED